MNVSAKLSNLRKSPRKVRLTANLVKGMDVLRAEGELKYSVKDAAEPILKLLNSAVANAVNNFQLDKNNLYISKITVDNGPSLKRWRARAYGRAAQILKRTSHIKIILSEKIEGAGGAVQKANADTKGSENKIDLSKGEKKQGDKKFDFKKEDKKLKNQNQKGIKKVFRRKSI